MFPHRIERFVSKAHRWLALALVLMCAEGSGARQVLGSQGGTSNAAQARREDWRSPAIAKDDLPPAQPLVMTTGRTDNFTLLLIRLQWRPMDPIDLYVALPKGVEKPPVILYLFGHPTTTDRFKSEAFQKLATDKGFASVGFVPAFEGQRFHERGINEWFVSELQESLATTSHDVQRVLDYLDTRPDLDMSHVGMFAQGSGATIAILAAAVDSRIQALDLVDPWGDWPDWLAGSSVIPEDERAQFTKPEFLDKVENLDPIRWFPSVKSRAVRLQDVLSEDRTPKAAKQRLRSALPASGTYVAYPNPKEFETVASSGAIFDWIKEQLRTGSVSAAKPQP